MKFTYIGTNTAGEMVKGLVEAEDQQEAQKQLVSQKIEVTLLKEQPKKKGQIELYIGHVSSMQLLFFAKHLSIMLKAGISIFEGLEMLQAQAKGRLKSILKKVNKAVSGGEKLSIALERYSKDFPELIVQLIASGELSGTLEESLNYIAEFIKKEVELKKKVKSAMLYPTIVFIAVVGLGLSIALFVLPQILPLFGSLNVDLPRSTEILIWVAELFSEKGFSIFLGTVAFVFISSLLLKSKWVKPFSHWVYLHTPVVGEIIRELNLARLFRVLATLMEAGIAIDAALQASENIVSNYVYKKELRIIQASVVRGNPLSQTMQGKEKLFPAVVSHMIKVGERSGNLSESMQYLGGFYESEVDEKLKNISTLIEPVMLIFIGLVVAGVAFSIIGPIYSLSGGIR